MIVSLGWGPARVSFPGLLKKSVRACVAVTLIEFILRNKEMFWKIYSIKAKSDAYGLNSDTKLDYQPDIQ